MADNEHGGATEHMLAQAQRKAQDKMAWLANNVPNGGQAVALQLCILELEKLKDMLFGVYGPLEGRGLEHAFNSVEAFSDWADHMKSQLLRARITNLGSAARPNGTL